MAIGTTGNICQATPNNSSYVSPAKSSQIEAAFIYKQTILCTKIGRCCIPDIKTTDSSKSIFKAIYNSLQRLWCKASARKFRNIILISNKTQPDEAGVPTHISRNTIFDITLCWLHTEPSRPKHNCEQMRKKVAPGIPALSLGFHADLKGWDGALDPTKC